jgi:hypothetical protein
MNAKIRKVNGVDVLEVQCPINVTASKSGKTTVVASSRGNRATAATVKVEGAEHPIIVGLNAYVQVPSTPAAAE